MVTEIHHNYDTVLVQYAVATGSSSHSKYCIIIMMTFVYNDTGLYTQQVQCTSTVLYDDLHVHCIYMYIRGLHLI